MLDELKWKEISVYKICIPKEKFIDLSIPSEEYLFDRFRIGKDEREIFSIEAAMLLTKIHPIIVLSGNNICVAGIRTLFIASSIIPTAKISVGVLPATTTDREIEQLILADAWLTRLAFSTSMPEARLFQASKKMPKELIRSLSPALNTKVVDFAKALSVSVPTLYSSREPKKGSKV